MNKESHKIDVSTSEDSEGIIGSCCMDMPLEVLVVFVICLLSFGNIYKAIKVYNFGELKKGYVISKTQVHYYDYSGKSYDYYVHIDILGKPLELSNYSEIPEHENIDFFIYNNNPDYFVYTGSNKKEWKPILKASLNVINKVFLVIFIIFSIIMIVFHNIRVIVRVNNNTRLKVKEIGRLNVVLINFIHVLILIFGFLFSLYISVVFFNIISNNEDISIVLAGFYMFSSLLLVLFTPFIIQFIFNFFRKAESKITKTILYLILIFSISKSIFGIYKILKNHELDDFTKMSVLEIIEKFWDIILG